MHHLIGLKFGIGTLDYMNQLKNKRIQSIKNILHDQLRLALVQLENAIRGTICRGIRHKLMLTSQILVTLISTLKLKGHLPILQKQSKYHTLV